MYQTRLTSNPRADVDGTELLLTSPGGRSAADPGVCQPPSFALPDSAPFPPEDRVQTTITIADEATTLRAAVENLYAQRTLQPVTPTANELATGATVVFRWIPESDVVSGDNRVVILADNGDVLRVSNFTQEGTQLRFVVPAMAANLAGTAELHFCASVETRIQSCRGARACTAFG